GTVSVAIGNGSLTGLSCNTTYHFRAVVTSSSGTATGADATFTTAACQVRTVVTSAASGITATGAALNGTANPNGTAASGYFDYGLTTAYTSAPYTTLFRAGTVSVAIGNGSLTGLSCNTTYHFRAVVTSGSGTATGADATF